MELIVVDDGSNLETCKLLETICHKSQNRITIINQSNQGQNAARRSGINCAKGRYIGFLDSDDTLFWPDFVKVLDASEQSDADIIGFGCDTIAMNGKETGSRGFHDINPNNEAAEIRLLMLSRCAELWLQFIKASLLTAEDFFPGSSTGEDLAVTFPAIARAKSFAILQYKPYKYFSNADSTLHSLNPLRRLTVIDSFEYIIHMLGNACTDYHEEIEWQAINHILYAEPWYLLSGGLKNREYVQVLNSWVDATFPNWKGNHYLINQTHSLAFKLIVHRKYILFALLHRVKTLITR
jgi:glycosyltransferase involved in cell wall biosynthesis